MNATHQSELAVSVDESARIGGCPYTAEIVRDELAPALAETAATRIEASASGIRVYAPAHDREGARTVEDAAQAVLADWDYRPDRYGHGSPEGGERTVAVYRLKEAI